MIVIILVIIIIIIITEIVSRKNFVIKTSLCSNCMVVPICLLKPRFRKYSMAKLKGYSNVYDIILIPELSNLKYLRHVFVSMEQDRRLST